MNLSRCVLTHELVSSHGVAMFLQQRGYSEKTALLVSVRLPSITRVGADDRTVLPFLVRRVWRALRAHGARLPAALGGAAADVAGERGVAAYKEIPAKEHWWWDTKRANDGGVNNDAEARSSLPETRARTLSLQPCC